MSCFSGDEDSEPAQRGRKGVPEPPERPGGDSKAAPREEIKSLMMPAAQDVRQRMVKGEAEK